MARRFEGGWRSRDLTAGSLGSVGDSSTNAEKRVVGGGRS